MKITNMRTIHDAAYSGDLEAVRQYVAEGDDINALDQGRESKNLTALGVAAHEGHAEVVQFLLAHGANPNVLGENVEPLLFDALYSANIEVVCCLLDYGADVNATDANGSHALINLASWSGLRPGPDWAGIARLFIAAGADLNHANDAGMTALKIAVFEEHSDEANLEVVRLLLEAGAEIDATPGEDGWTALMVAVSQGNLSAAQLLVGFGANINQTDLYGDMAWNQALRWGHTEIAALLEQAGAVEPAGVGSDLHRAILWGKTEAVSTLLAQGADANANANAIDTKGQSALIAAIREWGKEEIVRLLLEHGADIDAVAKYEHYELTPLMVAVQPGSCLGEQRAIVRLLIQRGANVSSTGYAEATALVIAAEEPDEEIVRLLLDAGADVNAADREGTTALMNAAWTGNYAMVLLLLERGANVNARTTTRSGVGYYGGATALSRAVGAGHVKVIRLLLDHGADIDAQNDAGTTALMEAAQEHHGTLSTEQVFSMVQLLLERGADVNRATIDGTTALDEALWGNRADMVRLLERAGAKRSERHYFSSCSTDASNNSNNPEVACGAGL